MPSPFVRLVFITIFLFLATVSGFGQTVESQRTVVELGFPIITVDQLPDTIDLTKPNSASSAFLLQLRRQAVLLAARDELGAVTRDAFLDEKASDDSVRISDVAVFPNADPEYVDHSQFLANLERLSRNEFVVELQKLGVQKFALSDTDESFEKDVQEIEKLLVDWALIPQFEAVRRTHEAIQKHGESLHLLKLLVRGYSQLQILTNNAPRDTHRVFQSRAMLYAQRAVAKYGETSETLALRAAAWSLNNFHRLAREDFDAIPKADFENSEPWVKLARLYAEFDIKGTAETIDDAEFTSERGLASLLHFMLLDYSRNWRPTAREFGEKAIADLPDCARFYQGVFTINTFDMIHAPNGSPFHEHLARRVAPSLRTMRELPSEVQDAVRSLSDTTNPRSGGLFGGLFGGRTASQNFTPQEFFLSLADVLKAFTATTPANDPVEPSLQALATLLKDEQMDTVYDIGRMYRGRNGSLEMAILPAMPVIGDHPAFAFLTLGFRDPTLSTKIWDDLLKKDKEIPYNLLSMKCVGTASKVSRQIGRVVYSPPYAACLFADMENIRDVTSYYFQADKDSTEELYFFIVDVFERLCPKNPYTVFIRIQRDAGLSFEDVETLGKEYGAYPVVSEGLFGYYEKHGLTDKLLEGLLVEFDARPKYSVANRIADIYLNDNQPDKAIEIQTAFMKSPASDAVLTHSDASLSIGRILLQQGKFEEAEPYFAVAARTGSNRGLRWMGHYFEIVGQFDKAESLYMASLRSYPENGPFDLWNFNYCTNGQNLSRMTDAILEQFALSQPPHDFATRTSNRMEHYQVIYPCYILDLPYPKQFLQGNTNALYAEYRRSNNGNGMIGFLEYFNDIEKGEVYSLSSARSLLREFRGIRKQNANAQTGNPVRWVLTRDQVKADDVYQRLATLIEADQQTEKPGNLDLTEVEFLLRSSFTNDFKTNDFTSLLYILGRYYDICKEPDKAKDCYRRILAVRADFDGFSRSLAVKELRKHGMTNEEYVQYSQGDPRFPQFNISNVMRDVLCRQHFQVYTESPAASVLARPVAAEPAAAKDYGSVTSWTPALYKVTNVLFRGHQISSNDKNVYWMVPEIDDSDNADWSTIGFAISGPLATQVLPQREDGTFPLRFGRKGDAVSARASFHDNHLILVVSLVPDEEPTSIHPEPESNCVRIEMQKDADLR